MNYPSEMCLYGWTSTSMEKTVAENFAYEVLNTENPIESVKRVVFCIHWHDKGSYLYTDEESGGSFPHENEVLLFDGCNY